MGTMTGTTNLKNRFRLLSRLFSNVWFPAWQSTKLPLTPLPLKMGPEIFLQTTGEDIKALRYY